MATRNVVLTQHREELIAALVESGKFQNTSEVPREGLRLLQRDVREFEQLQRLRTAVQQGWDDVEAGRCIDIRTPEEADAYWDGVRERVAGRVAARARAAG